MNEMESEKEMAGFENFERMFAQSIGIEEPWRVEKAEFDSGSMSVHIYIRAKKTAKYQCPECGQ